MNRNVAVWHISAHFPRPPSLLPVSPVRDAQEGKGKGCAREGFSLQTETPERGCLHGKQVARIALAASPTWSSLLQLFVRCTRAFWAVCTEPVCHWEGAILFSVPFTTLNFRPLCLIQLYLSHLISWFLVFLFLVILFFSCLEVFT